MIKIAICDDVPLFLEQICNLTEQVLNKASIPFIVDSFLSGEELIQKSEEGVIYDIALLDIQMDKISGIDVGMMLRQQFKNKKTLLIYISSFDSRAKEAFYSNAIRFLSKPIEPHLFEEALLHACRLIQGQENRIFTFKDIQKGQTVLPLSDIFYFDITESHKINIITESNKYVFYGAMANVEKQLSEDRFLRIHQAYLINIDHILEINYKDVTMENNVLLKISGARRTEVRRKYLQLMQRSLNNWL